MKKLLLIAAAVQFVLAAVLVCISILFRQTASEAAELELQLAANCTALNSALKNSENTYNSTGGIVDDMIKQLRKLSASMQDPGKLMRAVLPRKVEKQLAEIGRTCGNTAAVLDEYRHKTSPEVTTALQETAKSLEMTGNLIRDRQPCTRISLYVLLLGISFAVICFFNGSLLAAFAFMKKN